MLNNIISEHNGSKRNSALVNLYKEAFPAVANYVSRMGGSFEEAKDIFQDAVVLGYEKMLETSFSPEKGDKAYILGIAKNLWLKSYRSAKRYERIDDYNGVIEDSEGESNIIAIEKISGFLAVAGQKCMKILQAVYYDQLSMKSVAAAFGFGSTRSATVQKYKCLEKLRTEIKSKSMNYEDFIA